MKCYTFAFHLCSLTIKQNEWPHVMIHPGSIHSISHWKYAPKITLSCPHYDSTLGGGFLWDSLHASHLPILSNLWHDSLLTQAMILVETLLAFFTLDCLLQIQFGEQG